MSLPVILIFIESDRLLERSTLEEIMSSCETFRVCCIDKIFGYFYKKVQKKFGAELLIILTK